MRVIFERNVPCTLRDGVVLMANVFRPEGDGSYPVVLTRLPYGKDTGFLYMMLDPVALSESGYIVAIQDVRGRFASGGDYQGFGQEFDDGYDTVEWASKLAGSNGQVGMYGASYFGYTQLAAAATGHPALKTLTPTIVFDDPLDGVTFRNGVVEWGTMAGWYMSAMAPPELVRKMMGQEDFLPRFGRMVYDVDHLPEQGYFELPLSDFSPLRRTELFPNFFSDMTDPLELQWQLSIRPHYEQMTVSAAFTGGWYDIFTHSTIESYLRVKAAGNAARLTIGPWTHMNQSHEVGDLSFGMAANNALLDLREDPTTRHRRWFDSQLKGVDNGVLTEPPIKLFVMGENRWKSVSEWPLAQTVYTAYYLHSTGNAQTRTGDGSLSMTLPAGETPDSYVYDPADPVMTYGGSLLMPGEFPSGPKEQSQTESRTDVLVYTSEALTEPLEVTGPIEAKLWVTSSAVDTDFVVRLTDVHPDGRSFNIVDGILRLRSRNGADHDEAFIKPGTVYPITVDCWATSNVFLPGHRLRVQVTSSNFPRWNRNLNTGASNEETAEFVSATQHVLHDAEHPSQIVLPVIPR